MGMSREKAIDLLDNLIGMIEDNHNSDYDTALKMGIKALKQEPIPNNDLGVDCISREQVLEQVDKWRDDEFIRVTNPLYYLRKRLNDLPSVTPQEPRWISVSEDAPPKGTICLWCNKQGHVFTSEITYRSECSSYVGKHGYFSNGLENHGDIVAWMPLPLPWKGE